MAWQHSVDPAMPDVRDVVAALPATTRLSAEEREDARVPGRDGVRHTADWTVLTHLLTVLDPPGLHSPVRATLRAALRRLADTLRPMADREQQVMAAELIDAYLADPRAVRLDPLPRVPPGAPN